MRASGGEDLAMDDSQAAIHEMKQRLRAEAHAARDRQPDKDAVSRRIGQRCAALPECQSAATVMLYLDARSEVRTGWLLSASRARGQRVVVPYCMGDDLGLFLLESPEELVRGTFGILEPRPALRGLPPKEIPVEQVDLIVVPGVAFDRQGARLGHGKGYYDHLLHRARAETARIALAYECQMFPRIPSLPHDVPMHAVVTEAAVYRCGASAGDSAVAVGREPREDSLSKEIP